MRVPTLRKDFTLHEAQIYQAILAGADAVLLIVAALNDQELGRLHHRITRSKGTRPLHRDQRERHGAVQQTLHEQDRGRIVWPQDGSKNADRIDHGQFQAPSFPRDEIPSLAFGDSLRFRIGLQPPIAKVRPILFRERDGSALGTTGQARAQRKRIGRPRQ
jgi:indole-3-glycerol phosphate synthase